MGSRGLMVTCRRRLIELKPVRRFTGEGVRVSASNLFLSESDFMKRQASVLLPFALGLAVAAATLMLFRGQSSPARGESGQIATGGGDIAARSADRSGMLAELALLNDFRAGRVSSYDPSGANADGRQDKPI